MAVILAIALLFAGAVDILLWEARDAKKTVVFAIFFLAGLVLVILQASGVNLPSPARIIETAVKSLGLGKG